MKSVMNHSFSRVPNVEIQRSVFDRSHGHKTTINADYLYPIFVDEALPGDTFHLNASMLCRMATPIAPIMDNLFLDTFYFAVPNRLLWDNWERFMGAKDDPDDDVDYVMPVMQGALDEGDLGDYLGLPMPSSITVTVLEEHNIRADFFRAYNLIYSEFFRDQNLIEKPIIDRTDGPDELDDYPIRKRAKKHDYFTSCLPWPQRGDAVELPLGLTAPVIGNGKTLGITNGTNNFSPYSSNGSQAMNMATAPYGQNVGYTTSLAGSATVSAAMGVTTDATKSGLIADLSNATAATINSLREAFQLQKYMERLARSGSRYTEIIKGMFGVTNPDFRLQRPEYLGGSSTRININAVQQTAPSLEDADTNPTTPLGTLGAYSVTSGRSGFSKSFSEHHVIIGLANIRSDLTYSQGLNKMWTRQTKYDFYWPSFAHLGEQEVKRGELYWTTTQANNDIVFGYQERYAEYRYKPSMLTGKFRMNATTNLDVWHVSEKFGSAPTLNKSFIESNTPIDRVLAVNADWSNQFILDIYNDYKCARPMPVFSVPGLIDHF